ncbi:MAG TPA: translation initiation factor IF-2 N-terminal domain-containing protein, partial [Candidatus Binatia bacterium]|nr:translation initiation factor IF-2 N-terminal domain-containing protein [Candidatus Binatia bacterium]
MAKTRVSVLAKDLGLDLKDLSMHLDKLGIRGKKSQSTLEDDEVARVKAALAAPARPQVVVGEEKVVADRVVTTEDQQAHEQVVERRVRANVIRRRTNRTEVLTQ